MDGLTEQIIVKIEIPASATRIGNKISPTQPECQMKNARYISMFLLIHSREFF